MRQPKWNLLWLGLVAIPVHAGTYNVDSSADLQDALLGDGQCASSLGTCTLRAAIQEANLQSSGTSLIVVPTGVYTLSIAPQGTNDAGTGDLNLVAPPGTSIIVQGAGPGRTVVDASQIDRVFRIENNSVALLSGLTIRNGLNADGLGGGGVHSLGILTIVNANIESNSAPVGGGIVIDAVDSQSIGTLINTTVQHNQALGGAGGGILVLNSNARIYSSTINNNFARSGGGIFNIGTSYIVNSTIANNAADEDGGGVYNFVDAVFLYNTTVVGNDSDHNQDDVGGFGGGIANSSEPSARFGIVNSLLSDNTVRNAPVSSNCAGTIELYGTNLTSSLDATCTTINGNFALVTPSLIGSLQDNGGPTLTAALLSGSEAVDSTVDALGCVDETGAALSVDQRGAPRPAGARCDVGAYEYGSVAPVTDTIFTDGFE